MKILLPIDGSAASLAAVRHALDLRAQGLACSFVLVNVQEHATLYEVAVVHDAEALSDMRRAAGSDLLAGAEALLSAAHADFEIEVAGGTPATLILELIDNYGADAVFVGTSRPGGGEITQALLEHSPVPVTVVHEPEAS